jgi:hypothetical protein
MSQTVRSLLVLVVGGAALVFAAGRLVNSPAFRLPKDFPEYWAAGRLNLRGENPYDPARLLAEQQAADPARADAVMMWNPPHSLAVYMPLGLLPARWAALLWCGLQFAAVMLACDLLWRQYALGRPRWPGILTGLAFVGTWWVVAYGQNTGLLILGLAGFLHFRERDKPVAAGACAALTALKPHLLAGFGVLLLVDALTRRGAVTLAAGVGVIAVSLGIAVAANPDVVSQFLAALRDPGPKAVSLRDWALPVPAYWLRVAIDRDAFWLQFLPCAVACVALAVWRLWNSSGGSAPPHPEPARIAGSDLSPRGEVDLAASSPSPRASSNHTDLSPRGEVAEGRAADKAGEGASSPARWNWPSALPLVVALSVLAAPYGGWIFDLPVLLVPVVWCAARLAASGRWPLFAAFLVGQAAVNVVSFATPGALQNYWWVGPAALLLCLLGFVAPRNHLRESGFGHSPA